MGSQKGFSLIELLIAVAIILIIAAIAIPSFLRSRIAANEAAAASTVRSLMTAQIQYKTDSGSYAAVLDDLSTARLIDPAIGTLHQKSGYKFDIPMADVSNFQVTAEPIDPGQSGYRAYCSDGGAIFYDGNSPTPGSAANCIGHIAANTNILNN